MKKVYRVTENDDPKFPYQLVDENGVCLAIGPRPNELAGIGFDRGAAEVVHAYDLVKAGGV